MDEANKNSNNHKNKIIAAVVFACIGVAGLISVFFYIHYKASHITTDDAFIDGHIHSIAAKIPGTVKAVFVEENQSVKKGRSSCGDRPDGLRRQSRGNRVYPLRREVKTDRIFRSSGD